MEVCKDGEHVYGTATFCDDTITLYTERALIDALTDKVYTVDEYNYCPECGTKLKEEDNAPISG